MKYEIEWLTDEQPVANECGVFTKPNAVVHLFGTKGVYNKSFLRLKVCEFAGEGYRYAVDCELRENGNQCGWGSPIDNNDKLFGTIEECIVDFVRGQKYSAIPRYWWSQLVDEFIHGTSKKAKHKKCETCFHREDIVGHSVYYCDHDRTCPHADKYFEQVCKGEFYKEDVEDEEYSKPLEYPKENTTKNKQLSLW